MYGSGSTAGRGCESSYCGDLNLQQQPLLDLYKWAECKGWWVSTGPMVAVVPVSLYSALLWLKKTLFTLRTNRLKPSYVHNDTERLQYHEINNKVRSLADTWGFRPLPDTPTDTDRAVELSSAILPCVFLRWILVANYRYRQHVACTTGNCGGRHLFQEISCKLVRKYKHRDRQVPEDIWMEIVRQRSGSNRDQLPLVDAMFNIHPNRGEEYLLSNGYNVPYVCTCFCS